MLHLKRVKWEDAEMICNNGETTATCDFVNEEENIKISRHYEFLYGFLVRLWGIDIEYEEETYHNITFYLKEKDYKKLRKGQLSYEDFVLFRENKEYPNNINYQEYIPFFGVRKVVDSSPFMLTLFLDIWLDNHNTLVVFTPLFLIGIFFWVIFPEKKKDEEDESEQIEEKDKVISNSNMSSILKDYYEKFIGYGAVASLVAYMLDIFIL